MNQGTKPTPAPHRGRVQAQDPNLEKSVRWQLPAPPTTADGHDSLADLAGLLARRERSLREQGFEQAHRAVDRAGREGGVPSSSIYP